MRRGLMISTTLNWPCAAAAGASFLHVHLHHFEPNGGVSGAAVLAERHISIHTWPERGYAAVDAFMCGKAKPERCVPVLRQANRLFPEKVDMSDPWQFSNVLVA
jgi:S-adenosylmethionine decarboxylase proenzyme